MPISATGLAGLDVESLVTQLVGADSARGLAVIDSKHSIRPKFLLMVLRAHCPLSIVASECGRFRDFSSEKVLRHPYGESVVSATAAATPATKLR